MEEQFKADVNAGLSAKPKYINSKYFYDKEGDRLFQQIMDLPEYYLTRSEYEIFDIQKDKILKNFKQNSQPFDLIEFGAGDGLKTKVILKYFLDQQASFKYFPIDISANIIKSLSDDLKKELPDLQFQGMVDDYFEALKKLNELDSNEKVILFLGSNIGNFTDARAREFLNHLSALLNKGDKVMIGFDLKKDPKIIKDAYNDKQGVTRAFNLNLLRRINEELEADFDLTSFKHQPTYDPQTGAAKSFLVSTRDQDVCIKALNKKYHFNAWETIFVEVSQKYDLEYIESLARQTGFKISENLFDCKHYFVDSVWEKV